MLSFKLETISPTKAKKMLAETERAGFTNRNATNSFISRYAGDMEKGNWESDTGETIKVGTNGAIIDGQHRLRAIIEADKTVKVWVCRGIDPGMFQYIDQGKPRDLQDIMSIDGWDNPRDLAVVGKMLWRYDRDAKNNPFAHAAKFNESDGNIYDWILTVKPDLRSVWASYSPLIRKCYNKDGMGGTCPVSLMFYLLYQWLKEDADKAILFFGYLSEGVVGTPPHNAVAFFREYCADMKREKDEGRLAINGRHADLKEVQLKAALYAWDLYTTGRRSVSYSGFKSGLGQRNANLAKAA